MNNLSELIKYACYAFVTYVHCLRVLRGIRLFNSVHYSLHLTLPSIAMHSFGRPVTRLRCRCRRRCRPRVLILRLVGATPLQLHGSCTYTVGTLMVRFLRAGRVVVVVTEVFEGSVVVVGAVVVVFAVVAPTVVLDVVAGDVVIEVVAWRFVDAVVLPLVTHTVSGLTCVVVAWALGEV